MNGIRFIWGLSTVFLLVVAGGMITVGLHLGIIFWTVLGVIAGLVGASSLVRMVMQKPEDHIRVVMNPYTD